MTPYTSTAPIGSDGFAPVLRAEWTKFRTVRAWVIAAAAGAVLMIVFGLLVGSSSHSTIATPDHPEGIKGHPYVPIGPGGQPVTDAFSFVHQPLTGDGTITAEIGPLTGAVLSQRGSPGTVPAMTAAAVQPWAKAGLIIKASTSQGSAYASIMVTGGHGVRMQYNYTGDIAGPATTAAPRWLRLTRAGGTVTGYTSTDGTTWTTVGKVHLGGLPADAPAGLFVASPLAQTFSEHLGGSESTGQPALASATFDHLGLPAGWSSSGWTATAIGTGPVAPAAGDGGIFRPAGGAVTVTGSGDIAPDVGEGGDIASALTGAFATLTVLVVLAVLFITTEYRRGLIRTSFITSPRRGRVLAAKATVIALVTFVIGLIGAAIAVPVAEHLLRANGNFIAPITVLTWVRVVAGTAGLLAVGAVLALAIGTILRRSAAAVAVAVVVVVLPFLLSTANVLPAGAAEWVLRITPAAAFAIQQTVPAYSQVDNNYLPGAGFFPLAPWAGFAVLCAWAAVALGIAVHLLRRRDA